MRKQSFKIFGARVLEKQTGAPGTRQQRERGITVAIAAFSFVTFLLAAGLAMDVSHFYLAGSELQNAADAAALAAAQSLDSTTPGITKATDNAVAAMNKYDFNNVSVSIARSNVLFATNIGQFDNNTAEDEATAKASPGNIRFVKVTVPPKDVGVYLAKIALNVDTVALTRTAVAGQSESGATGDITPNELCNVYRVTLVEGDSAGDGSLDRTDPNCGSSFQYTQGCTYNVHLTPPCDAQLSYYEILQDDGGVTYTDWDDRLASRTLQQCFWNGKVVSAYTHPVAANIKNGLNTAFNAYGGGLTNAQFPSDSNIKTGITFAQYKTAIPGSTYHSAPGNALNNTGERILVLPIIKKSSFVVLDAAGEQANMTIDRFGAFFMVNKVSVNTKNNTADFKLEYIGDRVVLGDARVNPTRTTNSTVAKGVAVPVLYR
ncbi:MAG: hypothetical protein HYR56_30165 [Acidobacteria bacterium]|nr:hypothetical protein [Acidobacteriota bacterium]MBI3423684.1 hypothetical protein [Acidobacteriota bacterium]